MAGYGVKLKRSERESEGKRPQVFACGNCGGAIERGHVVCGDCRDDEFLRIEYEVADA